jgi:O-6-methylguanine DNA methyltransferase
MVRTDLSKCSVTTSAGTIWVCGNRYFIKEVSWTSLKDDLPYHTGELDWFEDELLSYLSGKLKRFTGCLIYENSIPLWSRNADNRDFPETLHAVVMKIMSQIPYGTTITYGSIAEEARGKGYARAVGSICGKNPLVIIVPCHRVFAASSIGGYSSGLDKKRFLLKIEGICI